MSRKTLEQVRTSPKLTEEVHSSLEQVGTSLKESIAKPTESSNNQKHVEKSGEVMSRASPEKVRNETQVW